MKDLMRENFVNPSLVINSNDEVHQLDQSLVIPPAMPNLLQDNVQKSEDDVTENEMLTVSCDNSEPSTITPAEHESKGKAHGATLMEGENNFNVLNSSTNHAIIEQLLVEPSLDLSLSHDNLLDVPCNKDELVDDASVLHVLEPTTCAENKHVIHIATKTNEFKLLSSLHTLGYIEFNVLCNLDYLEESLFKYANLPWFSKHTYHVIGKYNNKGQYMCRCFGPGVLN